MLKGQALIEHMARRAIQLDQQTAHGIARSDLTRVAEALAVAYLDGAIAALADETIRIKQEATDGLAHPEKVGG